MDGPWAWMRLIEKVTVAFGMEWACVLCGRSVSFGMGGMDMIWIWMNLISFVRLTIADIYIYIYIYMRVCVSSCLWNQHKHM